MRDIGLLIIRLTTGGLLIGHGSQKLFGWFGGYGPEGTGGWMESIGLRPGHRMALLSGLAEFTSGLLTAIGLFHPVGPITILGPMAVATGTAHAGKPIWVSEGGAELPVTNMAIGLGLSFTGAGRYSIDRMLGIKMPRFLVVLYAISVVIAACFIISTRSAAQKQETLDTQSGEEVAEKEG